MQKYIRKFNNYFENEGMFDWQEEKKEAEEKRKEEKKEAEEKRKQEEEQKMTKKIIRPERTEKINRELKLKNLLQEKEKLSDVKYEGIFSSKEIRENYKNRMRKIVEKINKMNIDEIVFLDKGARLLGDFFSKVWDCVIMDKQKPGINFLNIGKEKANYTNKTRGPFPERLSEQDFKKVSADLKIQMLKTFGDKFKDKKICVIDEVFFEGQSLIFTNRLLKDSYPTSEIYGEWFDKGESGFYDAVKGNIEELFPDKGQNDSVFEIAKLRKMEKLVFEPESERDILAKPWQKEITEPKERSEHLEKIKKWRNQFKKMALEMMKI